MKSVARGYGAVAVAAAVLITYAIALRNGFAFDDVVLIPGDPRVRGALFHDLLTRPYWNDTTLGLYRPLTSITYALDWLLAPDSAAWFHFTNVIWHLLASLFAYLLLTRFFSIRAAMVAALVFAVHPVHVEAVANVVGRGELIAATFFLAACLAWSSNTLSPRIRLALTTLCYVLAMLAKESAVVLPAVLWLLEYSRRRRFTDYAVFFVALVSFMLLRHGIVGGIAPSRLDPTIEVTTSYGQRLITALQAWPVELKLLLFPKTLLADYGPHILLPITQFNSMATLGLMLVIVTLGGGLVALAQKRYVWALALLWFPITILPVSNLIIPIGVLVAERTLYLPSLAICFGIAAILSHHRVTSSSHHRIIAGAILLALAIRTEVRIPDWQSTNSIMLALLRDRPDNFRANWHSARMARAEGKPDLAVRRYDHALHLWPYREGLVQEAAAYGTEKNRKYWARDVAFFGTQRWPRNMDFHRLLAANAIDLGDTVSARRAVQAGLRVDPNDKILNDMWNAFGTKK